MVSKVLSMTRRVQPALDVDQIGMQMWGMGVLVIGLSLAMRLDNQSAMLHLVLLGALLLYLVGLSLVVAGTLHVLGTHVASIRRGQRTRLRYARSALLPLWYYVHGAPRAKRWALLRFDHGRAWAWGVECLIVAGIVETALMLAAQHPLWHQAGTLAVLAVVRVTLRGVREHVTAHGHGRAAG